MFFLEIPLCDFNKIYQGNQSYRWRRVSENKYIVIDGQKIVLVQQRKNKKMFLCSEDEFFDYWFNYFDCTYDYGKSLLNIKSFYKEMKDQNFFFSFLLRENKRMRMVNNDLFETMIYYALNENNRKQKFEKFLHTFGEKKTNSLGGLKITWFKFPNPEQIDLSYDCGLTRDEIRTLSKLLNVINDDKLKRLKMVKYEDDAYDLLQRINDDEVWIKNIMFYSLGFKDVFCINDKLKLLFKVNGISPKMFLKYNEVKGFLLELLKVNENGNN